MFLRFFGQILAITLIMLMPAQAQAQVEPIRVTASFSILGDMVKQIGGEAVEVQILIGPGQNSHHYQPKPQDVALLTDAEIIAINGLHFEGWMGRLIEASGANAKLLVASHGITPRHLTAAEKHHDHHEGEEPVFDPHAWQDLKNAEIYAKNIASALIEARPEYENFFKDQAVIYIKKIRALNEKLVTDFAAIPEEKRQVITNHDAFGYFAAAYGITFHAPVGVNMKAAPSAKDMASLMALVKEKDIRSLYIENTSSPRLMKQLAKDTKAQIIGVLYADALSPARGPAPTYLDMMAHNARLILKGVRR